ncbi:hypothetical protein LTR86_003816 [Recurvomyces mirabilis]|nr:hypothetical protein LTR86_003816 [Recurvomyces mirabilis]
MSGGAHLTRTIIIAKKSAIHRTGPLPIHTAKGEVEQEVVKVKKDDGNKEEWDMVSRKEATEQEKWVEVVWE